MRGLKILGIAMFVYGAVMLALLFSPQKSWALDHSIAEVVSYTDRNANDEVHGSVDDPVAYVGSAVMMFAGLWFWLLVPRAIKKAQAGAQAQMYGQGPPPGGPPPGGSPPGGPAMGGPPMGGPPMGGAPPPPPPPPPQSSF